MNKKLEIIILIILIIIILGLSFKIYSDSKNYNCNNCNITFSSQMLFQENPIEFNISINELFEGYINDKCPIFWDRTNGYMKNG